jgi:hypothetical protein
VSDLSTLSDNSYRLAIISDDLIPVFFHSRVKIKGRSGMMIVVLPRCLIKAPYSITTLIDHVLAALVDRAAQKPHKNLVGYELLSGNMLTTRVA